MSFVVNNIFQWYYDMLYKYIKWKRYKQHIINAKMHNAIFMPSNGNWNIKLMQEKIVESTQGEIFSHSIEENWGLM